MATAFEIILKNIEDQREGVARALVDGAARDYAEYKSMCGEIRGLSTAHMYIMDIKKKMEIDDDDE
jgi:hypothetical protein